MTYFILFFYNSMTAIQVRELYLHGVSGGGRDLVLDLSAGCKRSTNLYVFYLLRSWVIGG